MRNRIAGCALIVVIAAGCGGARLAAPGPQDRGREVVLVLMDGDSPFKLAVAERVAATLKPDGLRVVMDDTGRAENNAPSDYAAVVYTAEYWMWRTPRHAIRYFNRHDKPANVIFLITAGDPNRKVTKPFDAVTSASTQARVEPVSDEIVRRVRAMR